MCSLTVSMQEEAVVECFLNTQPAFAHELEECFANFHGSEASRVLIINVHSHRSSCIPYTFIQDFGCFPHKTIIFGFDFHL